jgi:hypothetical protein
MLTTKPTGEKTFMRPISFTRLKQWEQILHKQKSIYPTLYTSEMNSLLELALGATHTSTEGQNQAETLDLAVALQIVYKIKGIHTQTEKSPGALPIISTRTDGNLPPNQAPPKSNFKSYESGNPTSQRGSTTEQKLIRETLDAQKNVRRKESGNQYTNLRLP